MGILLVLADARAGQGSGTRRGGNGQGRTGDKTIGVKGRGKRRYAPGEVRVKFRSETDEGMMARIQREVHLETVRVISGPNLCLMKIVVEEMVEA